MFDILIVDDEQPARDRLRRLILPMSGYRVTGEAGSGAEALNRIRELDPDIVLLDISMPGMDGMALAGALQEAESAPSIVFCTAYQDQALRAFEVEAVDYVVKPVRAERLEKALLKASRYLGGDTPDGQEHFLRSTVGGKVVLTRIDRVICLLSEDKYTTVVHDRGDTVIDDSLTELEGRFPDLFFRVHRNALISRRHLRGLERTPEGAAYVLLSGTERKPEVSRRNLASLRKLLSELS